MAAHHQTLQSLQHPHATMQTFSKSQSWEGRKRLSLRDRLRREEERERETVPHDTRSLRTPLSDLGFRRRGWVNSSFSGAAHLRSTPWIVFSLRYLAKLNSSKSWATLRKSSPKCERAAVPNLTVTSPALATHCPCPVYLPARHFL